MSSLLFPDLYSRHLVTCPRVQLADRIGNIGGSFRLGRLFPPFDTSVSGDQVTVICPTAFRYEGELRTSPRGLEIAGVYHVPVFWTVFFAAWSLLVVGMGVLALAQGFWVALPLFAGFVWVAWKSLQAWHEFAHNRFQRALRHCLDRPAA